MTGTTFRKKLAFAVVLGASGLLLAGCASKKYVQDSVSAQETRISDIESQLESQQRRIDETGRKIDSVSKEAQAAGEVGRKAGTRADEAMDAAKAAQGKLLYAVVLSEVAGHFDVNKFDLKADAKSKLDALAGRLKAENKNVFLEIAGHCDSQGSERYNLELGERRAQAVRRYLNEAQGIPLHKMSIVSYGESKPVADNKTKEGRAQNRRVEVKVLS